MDLLKCTQSVVVKTKTDKRCLDVLKSLQGRNELQNMFVKVATLCMLGKISADDILNYFSHFSEKIAFDISCKLSPDNLHEMQSLFSGKI